jgi:cyclophilin family peptidyl-prolyl cis-trans isomerase
VSKVSQREKQKARRARRNHGLREEATAASRPRRRMVRAAVGVVAALGILLLGVLGSLVGQDAAQDANQDEAATPGSTMPAVTEPGEPSPPPCPATDGSTPRRTLFDAAPAMCIDPAASYRARFVTSAGVFIADLDQQRSPLAVNNFVFLARYHFYDDLPFHRVVDGFYAQTGDPVAPDLVGPGYTFPDDPLPPVGTYRVGSLVFPHQRANDNGSQILIFLGPDVAQIPHIYPLFGQVSPQGLDTLAEIGADGGNADDPTPDDPHRIERIDIIETP